MKEKARKRGTADSAGSGGFRPTIFDVAARARVSVATVSNALTGRRPVDPDTGARVKAAALALGYVPNLRAQRLRTGNADTIAIFSAMPFAVAGGPSRLGFLMEVAAAAAAQALQNGIAMILVPPLEKGRPPLDTLPIDGALVLEPMANDPDVALLRRRGIPVASIGRQPGGRDIPYVDLRSDEATLMLLEHLRTQSARRIALVVGSQARNSHAAAERAYCAAAARWKMRPIIARVDEEGGAAAGEVAVLDLLRKHPSLDALCVMVDVFAVGAASAAAKLGRRIPEELKLVTRYNGVRARECEPPLTALDLHLDRVAVLGVELLLARIRGGKSRHSVPAPLPTLVPRLSSAKPR